MRVMTYRSCPAAVHQNSVMLKTEINNFLIVRLWYAKRREKQTHRLGKYWHTEFNTVRKGNHIFNCHPSIKTFMVSSQ